MLSLPCANTAESRYFKNVGIKCKKTSLNVVQGLAEFSNTSILVWQHCDTLKVVVKSCHFYLSSPLKILQMKQ